jgi:hypothetical protein
MVRLGNLIQLNIEVTEAQRIEPHVERREHDCIVPLTAANNARLHQR